MFFCQDLAVVSQPPHYLPEAKEEEEWAGGKVSNSEEAVDLIAVQLPQPSPEHPFPTSKHWLGEY